MKRLAYIFGIALFLFGCGGSHIVNVSYDPIDYPPQFFSPKDKRRTLLVISTSLPLLVPIKLPVKRNYVVLMVYLQHRLVSSMFVGFLSCSIACL